MSVSSVLFGIGLVPCSTDPSSSLDSTDEKVRNVAAESNSDFLPLSLANPYPSDSNLPSLHSDSEVTFWDALFWSGSEAESDENDHEVKAKRNAAPLPFSCLSERMKRYILLKAKRAEKDKKYYQTHKVQIAEKDKKYYQTHKAERAARNKKYSQTQRDDK